MTLRPALSYVRTRGLFTDSIEVVFPHYGAGIMIAFTYRRLDTYPARFSEISGRI